MKSDLSFEDFIIKFDQSQDTVSEIPVRLRTQLSVLLEKRYRGETLGDRIGRWNYKTNNYVEPTLDLQPFNIYTDNIVKPKVRANAAVMSQAKIAVTCDPRVQTTRAKKNALICQRITDWGDDTLWTTDVSLHINEMKQLTHGVFIKSFWNEQKEGRPYKAKDWQDAEFDAPMQVSCVKCRSTSYLESLEQDEHDTVEQDTAIETPPCPECGGATEILAPKSKTAIPISTTSTKIQSGDNDLEIHPSLEYRVDEKRSQGAKLANCGWIMRYHLMSKFEIEQEFGDVEIQDPDDWPYPLKWLYTLQTGTSYPFKGYRQTQETIKQLALFPVRRYYFTPEWLAGYTAGREYRHDPKDGALFEIKDGENARDVVLRMSEADAQERGRPNTKKGLCVCLSGRRILGFQLVDFRKETEFTYFVSDPYSFWPLCYSELETSQHLVNQTLTAIGNQVQSNQNIGVFDRESYDDDDLSGEKNQIYTRDGNDKPISETFGVIPALPVTSDTWTLYQAMKGASEEASMVSKEMQGQPTQVKTFGQAQLNRDMSVGVLTPAQQSTAKAKVGVMAQQCLIAQEHWTPDRLQELCDTAEGIITDEDIETWFQSDLEADVVFSYREGSEMPKSFGERRDDIAYVSNYIATWAGLVPGIATPELAMDMINRVSDLSTIDDIDLRNAETDKEVAEVRYTIIVQGLEKELQTQLGVAQNPQQLQAQTLLSVLQNPILMPLKQENHIVEMEFYRDKCLLEYKKEQPNLLLVAALQEMIERHKGAMIAEGQSQTETQMAIQQPAIEAEAQANAAAQPQDAHPMQKVAESISFKDLPYEGQVQLAAQVGIQLDPNAEQLDPDQTKAEIEGVKLHLQAADMAAQHQTRQAEIEAENARTEADHDHQTGHKLLEMADKQDDRDHQIGMGVQSHHNALEMQKNAPKPNARA
jgi:hypothetical protein